MTNPSISIIVPVYNVEKYVEDCIRSVMRQTYTGPMECIIVDDCGTDRSMEFAERIISAYNGPITFTVLHHANNRGIASTRNTGIQASSGDYIFFLDSDDELTSDCIESLANPLSSELYDIVVGHTTRLLFLSSGQYKPAPYPLDLNIPGNTLLRRPAVIRTYRNGWDQTATNKLFNAQFVRSHHLTFNEELVLSEDSLWTFQIACLASSLFAVNKVTYLYKERMNKEESFTGHPLYDSRKAEAWAFNIKEMNRFLYEHHIDNKDVFRIFYEFFLFVMRHNLPSFQRFATKYKELRPHIKKPLRGIISLHRFHIRKYFKDLHFLMPISLATYWQYYVYYKLRPLA